MAGLVRGFDSPRLHLAALAAAALAGEAGLRGGSARWTCSSRRAVLKHGPVGLRTPSEPPERRGAPA
jgi:hypothetical protein